MQEPHRLVNRNAGTSTGLTPKAFCPPTGASVALVHIRDAPLDLDDVERLKRMSPLCVY